MNKHEIRELKNDVGMHVATIKKEEKIKDIKNTLSALNNKLNYHDTRIENLIDNISMLIIKSEKKKIAQILDDLIDNFDKYESFEQKEIIKSFNNILEVSRRDIWDRIRDVLRAS